MRSRTYTDNEFIDAVSSSRSIREVLTKLHLREAGGNYESCRTRIERMGLDTSHFVGQAWRHGKVFGPLRPVDDYLVSNRLTNTSHLRVRLIKEGLKSYICEWCGLTEWMGKPTPLELDHIDGNRKNNLLKNLRLLCPNCHSMTPTYRGRKNGTGWTIEAIGE